MRRLILSMAMGLSLVAAAQEPDVAIDLKSGVGPIRFDMLEGEIRKLGPISERYYFYHGKAWGETEVWPEDPLNRVIAVFSDPPDDRPAYLVLRGYGSRYVLPNGLRLGSSLEEAEKLNGRPFALRGMAQDDAGEVLGWCGGKLEGSLPGVKLFFHPLQDVSEGLSEQEMEEVCAGFTTSDAPIWKKVYIETGKIQVARPHEPLPPRGPEYAPAEQVQAIAPPVAAASLLQDAGAHNAYFPFAEGRYAFLLETPIDNGSNYPTTVVSLLRISGSGNPERLRQYDLDIAWEPQSLTVMALQEGGPKAGVLVANQGSLLLALLFDCDEPVRGFSFSLSRGRSEYPLYRLVRNAHNRPEIRQLWSIDGKLTLGPADYTWNGETFLFPDGSKVGP